MSGVVVGVGAVIGAVIGGGSALHGVSKQNRNLIKAFKKQMHYMQINYNYNQAALDRQERSMYDSAVANLFNLSVNAFQNQSQVEAAQAESGVEGRSQDKIGQIIRGTNLRQKTALKEAYEVDAWNVRSQKEALYIETKSAVEQARDNLNNNFIKGARMYAQVIQGASIGAALGAVTAGAGSAIGGAVGGAAGGSAGGSLGAGLSTTPITAGALGSTAGGSAGALTAGSMGGTTIALSGSSAATIAGGAGGVVALTSNASTGTDSTAISAGSKTGFMNTALSRWNSYGDYFKFYNQIANYGNMTTNLYRRQRGYYY